MIHFKGVGEHSVFELEKIILEQNELLHNLQIKTQELERKSCQEAYKDYKETMNKIFIEQAADEFAEKLCRAPTFSTLSYAFKQGVLFAIKNNL